MGNQLEKQYGIKEKPLKLPGSYNFLRFIHHPTQELSLIVVKAPHRATPIPSTLILPIKEIKQPSSGDGLAICNRCLPLALVKPHSESEMKILMHKIIRASTQLGRCFLYMGRIMLWCEQKRGICSVSPEELEHGKFHPKSKVFISGMALINFLHCVYENEKIKGRPGRKDVPNKPTGNSIKDKVRQKLQKKGILNANENLPQQIRLFFEPKDKKQFYELYYSMETRLSKSSFWLNISEGLRSLLMNMISEDPEKRIDLETILNIPYFMDSNQLRLYSTLTDTLEDLTPREAKVFMSALETLVIQGLTIESGLLQEYFAPVLSSMVSYNSNEGRDNDYLIPMALSIIIQLDRPPIDVIFSGLRKASAKNWLVTKLVLMKKKRLLQLLSTQQFDEVLSRAIFNSFESEALIQSAILCVPFAMGSVRLPNYRKEIELLLVSRVLAKPPQGKESLLLHALKCMIFLVREGLLTSYQKLEGLVYRPLNYSLQTNFHVLYLYGLMIENLPPQQLLAKMMPKLQLYLNELDVADQIFVVAKRCVDRILQRLYQQRKIDPQDMTELRKAEEYFDMAEDRLGEQDVEQTRGVLKREIRKHEMDRLEWTLALL